MAKRVILSLSIFILLIRNILLAQESKIDAAVTFFKKGLYKEVVEILEPILNEQGDNIGIVELMTLAESYYLLGDYGKARPLFIKALAKETTRNNQIICEYRLALIAYKLQDFENAIQRIENFVRKYPRDIRSGSLLVIKMQIISSLNKPEEQKLKQLEEVYSIFSANRDVLGYYNHALASQILGDFYIKNKQEARGISLFITAVHNMRGMVAEHKKEAKIVSQDLLKAVDSMALRIGKYYVDRKEWAEADKWLESVVNIPELRAQAQLLRAHVYFNKGQFSWVPEILTSEVIRNTTDPRLKADMYIILGLAYMKSERPDLERAKEMFKSISKDSQHFYHAMYSLGQIYAMQNDIEMVEKYYLEAANSTKFAPCALFELAMFLKNFADKMDTKNVEDSKRKSEIVGKAIKVFEQLISKYPVSKEAREASDILKEIMEKENIGTVVKLSEEDLVRQWQKKVDERLNTLEGLHAALSLAKYYSKKVYDVSGKKIISAPNWELCSDYVSRIVNLKEKPEEVLPEEWISIKRQGLYMMAIAELGSLPPGISERNIDMVQAVRMKNGGSADRALGYIKEAMKLIEPTNKELYKQFDIVMLEAMFKSENPQVQKQAKELFNQRISEYFKDPDYQRLKISLADWYADHEWYENAAEIYKEMASRPELEKEEVMHMLYLAGIYYHKAGIKLMADKSSRNFSLGILITPKEVIQGITIFDIHTPFNTVRRIYWEGVEGFLTLDEVLKRLSVEFDVPFIWSKKLQEEFALKRIPIKELARFNRPLSLRQYLENIFDLKRFSFDFDIGFSDGIPTIDVDPLDHSVQHKVIEIFSSESERFPPLSVPYGKFSQVHGNSKIMIYTVIQRIEKLTGAKIVWSEAITKEDILAQEITRLPVSGEDNLSCGKVLSIILESYGLTYKPFRQEKGAELLKISNDCFNELRKFGSETRYAEQAMFNIAINFYYLEDTSRMKMVLKEYLKLFDGPYYVNYFDACYWIGWICEQERQYREAVKYYTKACDERVIVYALGTNEIPPTVDQLELSLSYDTLVNLSVPASGVFKSYSLAEFLSFIRFYSNVAIEMDRSVLGITNRFDKDSFTGIPCLELLIEACNYWKLGIKGENIDKEVAQKAYYHLALTHKKDDMLPQALEYLEILLNRYPKTKFKQEALKLKLDIYRGMKSYREVLATLDELRTVAGEKLPEYVLYYEMGRIWFDMCNFEKAEEYYLKAISSVSKEEEKLKIREALVYTLYLAGKSKEALNQLYSLKEYERSPLRKSIYDLLIYHLEYLVSSPRVRNDLPESEKVFILNYEALSEEYRLRLEKEEYARACWIYFILGLQDILEGKEEDALKKFDAAANSPDSFVGGMALLKMADIYFRKNEYEKAEEVLEHLLFICGSTQPIVEGTYKLIQVYKQLFKYDLAFALMKEFIVKYPISPYVELIKQDKIYIERASSLIDEEKSSVHKNKL